MTKQNLLNFTAPEYEIIKIYDVIQNLAIETNETFSLWLLRIARSACPLGEPFSDCDIIPLILRPNEKWGIPKSKREVSYRQTRPSWFDSSAPMERAGSHLVHYHEDWNLEESVLSWVCTEYAYPPSDDRVFKGIDINFTKEGIVLHRSDFREWCLASGYPLPRFWFSDSKEHTLNSIAPQLQSNNNDKIKTGRGPLAEEIELLISEGIEPNCNLVWEALIQNAGAENSCIVCKMETEKGPAIKYRTASMTFKNLTKRALQERLRRRNQTA